VGGRVEGTGRVCVVRGVELGTRTRMEWVRMRKLGLPLMVQNGLGLRRGRGVYSGQVWV